MKKKIIISTIIFIVALSLIIFGLNFFHQKKTIQISVQNQLTEEQQIEDNQNTEENNQSVPLQQKDVPESQSKQAVNDKQEPGSSIQQTAEKTKNNESNDAKFISRFVSWGFEKATSRKIDTIIVHSSYDALGNEPYDVTGLIAEYKKYGVAAHYLIARGGEIYHLVEDRNIAYHAGESKVPDGRTGVNAFSIGIEMINTEDGKFTSDQYVALNQLIGNLKKQYSIKYILGHDDIAPGRKTDPWNIDWTKVQK